MTRGLSKILSHNAMAGMPSVLTAVSAATISASGVECDTHDWRLLVAESPANEYGPLMHRNTPVVDLIDSLHPAKSASEYRFNSSARSTRVDEVVCRSFYPALQLVLPMCKRL